MLPPLLPDGYTYHDTLEIIGGTSPVSHFEALEAWVIYGPSQQVLWGSGLS